MGLQDQTQTDGTIERHKARLVAKGYTQLQGIDYLNTLSHIAKLTTVRLLLTIAIVKNWHLHHLDVNNDFLHGNLEEEVYVIPPPGLITERQNQVYKFIKSLYGLRQTNKQWFAKLSSSLISFVFSQSMSDYSFFTRKTKKFGYCFTCLCRRYYSCRRFITRN